MNDLAPEKKSTKKAQCAECGGVRNCSIRGQHDVRGDDENFSWHDAWYLLECRGCEHTFVQKIHTNSEEVYYDYDQEGNAEAEYVETVNYWPALLKRKRPVWLGEIWLDIKNGERLFKCLDELYIALNNDLNILAGIGIRTSFDVASELLGIDANKSFEKKLKDLVAAGHIGTLDQSMLQTLVEAGSATAHRGWRPQTSQLNTMADVLEHFVYEAFMAPIKKKKLGERVAKIKEKVPTRKKQ